MRNWDIIKSVKIDLFDIIIYSTTFYNPFEYKMLLEDDLIKLNIKSKVKVLVDLLTCNGDSSNRFVTFEFSNGIINEDKIKIIKLNTDVVYEITGFYRSNPEILRNSVLSCSKIDEIINNKEHCS